ncbi:MAG TPA: FixH family protein [Thermoanaerobaculia bacterium]|nr:FixH family protein [Thermoanaerobaculia bacterium]
MKTITLLLLLAIAPFAFADSAGRFDAGTRYEEPALHAPANVSRMFAKSVDAASSIDLPATGNSGMIIWTIAGKPVATRLRTPTGAELLPTERGSIERGLRRFRENDDEVLHVMKTVAARYELEVGAPATVVVAEPESTVTLSTWAAPLSHQPGEPVTLHAELRNGGDAIAGAHVTARLTNPRGRTIETVTLADRGEGVYEITLDAPMQGAGTWQVRFDAEGATPAGTRFLRTGQGELVNERGAARLGAISTEIAGDALRVSLDADMRIAGAYRLDVIIADRDGNAVAWAEGRRDLNLGNTKLEMDIPLSLVGNASPEDLRFDVRLLGLDEIGVAGRVTR